MEEWTSDELRQHRFHGRQVGRVRLALHRWDEDSPWILNAYGAGIRNLRMQSRDVNLARREAEQRTHAHLLGLVRTFNKVVNPPKTVAS